MVLKRRNLMPLVSPGWCSFSEKHFLLIRNNGEVKRYKWDFWSQENDTIFLISDQIKVLICKSVLGGSREFTLKHSILSILKNKMKMQNFSYLFNIARLMQKKCNALITKFMQNLCKFIQNKVQIWTYFSYWWNPCI